MTRRTRAVSCGVRGLSSVAALMATVVAVAGSVDALTQACESARPRESVTVAYSERGDAQRVVFTPSDDGTLRATDAADGHLLWTYRSKEAAASTSGGSRMTDVRVLRFDARSDGVIDISDGDRVWLYFGVASAGTAYYALDVTDPSRSRQLWRIDAAQLPGAGESWSTPTIARVKVAGEVQNGEHFVLLLGGGYDTRSNASGNRVFMIDAATGQLLWSAGGAGAAAADLAVRAMKYPMVARVTAVDTDGDTFVDRLYAADLGGQVWRFDIWNGRARSSLVTGGVLASLGSEAVASASTSTPLAAGAQARRFFNGPDAALIQRVSESPYYNLALGSGDAALDYTGAAASTAAPVNDRFYSLRDRNAFNALSQPAYDAIAPILDSDLFDITDAAPDSRLPPEVPGWKLDLHSTASGERVLTESTTANGIVLFTSFEASASGCLNDGVGRVYALKVDTAEPGLDLNDDGEITADDRSMPLTTPGVPASVQIEIESVTSGASPVISPPGPSMPDDGKPTQSENTRCRVGTETLAHCVRLPALVRTFWRRHSTL